MSIRYLTNGHTQNSDVCLDVEYGIADNRGREVVASTIDCEAQLIITNTKMYAPIQKRFLGKMRMYISSSKRFTYPMSSNTTAWCIVSRKRVDWLHYILEGETDEQQVGHQTILPAKGDYLCIEKEPNPLTVWIHRGTALRWGIDCFCALNGDFGRCVFCRTARHATERGVGS